MGHALLGRGDAAGVLWQEALSLAQASFPDDDLRLATSFANHAFSLSRTGGHENAEVMYREALRIWDVGTAWIDDMVIERRARSSAFHIRMEVKHWKSYEGMQRRQRMALGVEGREAIAAMISGSPTPRDSLNRWHREKPASGSDYRKLLAAVLLIVDAGAIESWNRRKGE